MATSLNTETTKYWYLGEWWEKEYSTAEAIVYRSADGKKRLYVYWDGTKEVKPRRVSLNEEKCKECMIELAKWFVQHRRKMTMRDMRPIAKKIFPTQKEADAFYNYVSSPEGGAEFGKILRLEAWKAGIAGPEVGG